MMGAAVPNTDVPIVKITSAALAFAGKDGEPPEETACIKCGRCVTMCPMGLMPPYIDTAVELKKPEMLLKYKANMCAECGCCAYSCPAKRPLAQVMALANSMLRKYQQEQKAAKENAEKEHAQKTEAKQ